MNNAVAIIGSSSGNADIKPRKFLKNGVDLFLRMGGADAAAEQAVAVVYV